MKGLRVALGRTELELDGRRILGPLDIDVEAGDYACVLGPSGAGKTSLLRLVAGLVAPTRGEVTLGETVSSREGRIVVPPERRSVAMVFQGGALWPHMTVAGNLEFVLSRTGIPARDRADRARESLASVRLEGFERRMPGTLSGGEAQRVSIARALLTEPSILLLDEPLGSLDAELRGDLRDLLRELHGEAGCTVLHVTHDRDEVSRLAARTVEIDGDGRLVGSS